MRNVCLLNDSFPPEIDGVANVVLNYAENLKKMGHIPYVVTPDHPKADDRKFDYDVIRYPSIDLTGKVGYTAGVPIALKPYEMLKDQQIDLLHSHCPIASNVMARNLRDLMNVPIVMTYHTKYDIDIAKAIRSRLAQESALKALVMNVNLADEVWVVSHGAGENLRSLGYEGDYIVMENGVDVPKRRLPEDEVLKYTGEDDLPEGLPVFLFVGRLMWYKGIHLILDALAALKSQQYDFRMVFVGGGTDEAEIKAETEKLKLGDKVIFKGPISDREELSAWYCRADLFLFPSTFDTNGLVVREAAACSLGAVIVSGSCAAEGVTGERNGLLIEENAASLAVCLAKHMADRERMREIGQRAADELYISWESSVRKAAQRYEVVIEDHKSGRKHPFKKFAADEMSRLEGELAVFQNRVTEKENEWLQKLERYM